MRLADPAVYTYHGLISTTQDVRSKRAALIPKVLRALLKAEDFLKTKPADSIAYLSKAIAFDERILRETWPSYDFSVRLDNDTVRLMEDNFRYLQREDKNFAHRDSPNFSSFIDPAFLKAVAPERVKYPGGEQ